MEKRGTPSFFSVAFFKDQQGIVHLRGAATRREQAGWSFTFRPAFAPPMNVSSNFPPLASEAAADPAPNTRINIWGVDVGSPNLTGAVVLPEGPSNSISFDGITFRAEG